MTTTKKKTAKQIVAEQIDALRPLDVAGLTAAGKAAGFDSRSGFAAWKKALAAAGVDYNAMRNERRAEKKTDRESAVTHEVTLYSDAKARTGRFAICDAAGRAVWYGRFFASDRDFNGEQSTGEMAAAKKAVWLAGKIAEAVGGRVRLTLRVDAQWLLWANVTDPKRGGKAKELRRAAERADVVLAVEYVAGVDNPADAWTVCRSFQRWQDSHLPSLATPIAAK